jgi:hypothetical protein
MSRRRFCRVTWQADSKPPSQKDENSVGLCGVDAGMEAEPEGFDGCSGVEGDSLLISGSKFHYR